MPNVAGKSWFRMRADNGVGTINILGDIGGWGVNYQDFKRSLANMGPVDEIRMTIQSDGGDVLEGFAIYNELKAHPAKKIITIAGLAASMASVVAMAGDVRRMPKNAIMMIHNPTGGISGNSDEIISFGEAVGDMQDNIAQTYVDASLGMITKAKALALMGKQSWLGAEECLALGLCTDVVDPVAMNAHRSFENKESAMTTKTPAEIAAKETADRLAFEGASAEALATARKEERAAMLAQQKEVNAVCAVAKRPDLALGFNERGLTLAETVAELAKAPAKDGKTEVEINARGRVDTGDTEAVVIDSQQIYADYNHPGRITARNSGARTH